MKKETAWVEVNQEQWNAFKRWYGQVADYIWYPVTVSDRINILDASTEEMIAYKSFGGINGEYVENFYIRRVEFMQWQTMATFTLDGNPFYDKGV